MKKLLFILTMIASSVYAVSYNECPAASDISCEIINTNQEFCYLSNHKIMSPFWGGILVGEAPSTLDKPLPPIKLLLSEWALYPSEKTTSDLNPLPDSLGNISCFYNTRLPNVRIIMWGGYQMPYKNISEANNWISDKFASINSTMWYSPNDPTQPQVFTRVFICKNANINGNDCAFNMVAHDSVINNSYKQINEPQIIH